MSKVTKRLLLAAIGIPLLLTTVNLLPFYKHLVMNIFIIIVTGITSREVSSFFSNKGFATNPISTPFIGASIPFVAYLEIMDLLPETSMVVWLVILSSLILIREVFIKNEEEFPNILFRVSSSMIILLYPGLLISFCIRIMDLNYPSATFILLMAYVFGNDSMAYIFGMIFGKHSRGITFISPNKSLVGFIAGIMGSIIVGIVYWIFFREVISESILITTGVSIAVGITTIFGDLVASALKRSAEMKDSGNLIPGRGGLLDSVDSFLFTSPLLYFILSFIQNQ